MKWKTAVVVSLLCLLLGVPAAYGQAACTLQTLTGSYAFSERGASALLEPDSEPYPAHWAGAVAPFGAIGLVTFGADGVGTGYTWIRIGSFNTLPDPTPITLTVTELNEDCTGKWQFEFTMFGSTNTIEERFISFDNGRELRSIPTHTGAALAWVGEAHRISRPDESLGTCGPQTASGSYVMTAYNLVRFPTTPILSDAVLARFDVSIDGQLTGTVYEKFGPTGNIQFPVWGTMSVAPDCSFASTFNTVVNGVPGAIPIRGVFFDQGKRLYVVNVNAGTYGTQFSIGEGQRIVR